MYSVDHRWSTATHDHKQEAVPEWADDIVTVKNNSIQNPDDYARDAECEMAENLVPDLSVMSSHAFVTQVECGSAPVMAHHAFHSIYAIGMG